MRKNSISDPADGKNDSADGKNDSRRILTIGKKEIGVPLYLTFGVAGVFSGFVS